jgi:hypothetical protein
LITPETYNLCEKEPSSISKKNLIHVTRILQILANRANLEKESFMKDTFMIPFLDFMKENNEKFNNFLDFISNIENYEIKNIDLKVKLDDDKIKRSFLTMENLFLNSLLEEGCDLNYLNIFQSLKKLIK